jgi:hypothetical protein
LKIENLAELLIYDKIYELVFLEKFSEHLNYNKLVLIYRIFYDFIDFNSLRNLLVDKRAFIINNNLEATKYNLRSKIEIVNNVLTKSIKWINSIH